MLRLILVISSLLLLTAAAVAAPDVILKSGTQLSATNNSVIESGTMSPGDEVNFTLSQELKSGVGMIPQGSVIYGRVVEAEKSKGEKSPAKLVIMFDFLQVGEEFYSMSALIISCAGAQAEIQFKKAEAADGCTAVMLKGGDFTIPEATPFIIRLDKDMES